MDRFGWRKGLLIFDFSFVCDLSSVMYDVRPLLLSLVLLVSFHPLPFLAVSTDSLDSLCTWRLALPLTASSVGTNRDGVPQQRASRQSVFFELVTSRAKVKKRFLIRSVQRKEYLARVASASSPRRALSTPPLAHTLTLLVRPPACPPPPPLGPGPSRAEPAHAKAWTSGPRPPPACRLPTRAGRRRA